MTPEKKPQRGLDWLSEILAAHKTGIAGRSVVLIGLRGYYLDSMGRTGVNDRGIYDDAFFWLNLDKGFIASYNGNVDPSSYRKGRGFAEGKKGMASLKTGCWPYQKGIHRGYEAFVQAGDVTVVRDGINGDYEDTGDWFGINIHRGGYGTTSSEGCQTVPPNQWTDFKETGYRLLTQAKQKTFPYILEVKQG